MARMFTVAQSNPSVDFVADTIRVLLVKTGYTFDPDPNTVSAISGLNELTDASYTGQGASGRLTLGTKSRTEDDTNNRVVFDAADPVWTALDGGETVIGGIVFKHVTDDTDSVPICFISAAESKVAQGSDMTLAFDATLGVYYTENA